MLSLTSMSTSGQAEPVAPTYHHELSQVVPHLDVLAPLALNCSGHHETPEIPADLHLPAAGRLQIAADGKCRHVLADEELPSRTQCHVPRDRAASVHHQGRDISSD